MNALLPIHHGYFCGQFSQSRSKEGIVKIIKEPGELEEVTLYSSRDGAEIEDKKTASNLKKQIAVTCTLKDRNIILIQMTHTDSVVCGIKNIIRVQNTAHVTIARLIPPQRSTGCCIDNVTLVLSAPKEIDDVKVVVDDYDAQIALAWEKKNDEAVDGFYPDFHRRVFAHLHIPEEAAHDDEKMKIAKPFYANVDEKFYCEMFQSHGRGDRVQDKAQMIERYYQSLCPYLKNCFDELLAMKRAEQAMYDFYFAQCGKKLQEYMGEGTNFNPQRQYLVPNP